MTVDERRRAKRHLHSARGRIARDDHLVPAGTIAGQRRWKSALDSEGLLRLEAAAVAAVAGDDAAAATRAVDRWERAARATLDQGRRR